MRFACFLCYTVPFIDHRSCPQEYKVLLEPLRKGGIAAALCYYKIMTSDIDYLDNQGGWGDSLLSISPTVFTPHIL